MTELFCKIQVSEITDKFLHDVCLHMGWKPNQKGRVVRLILIMFFLERDFEATKEKLKPKDLRNLDKLKAYLAER